MTLDPKRDGRRALFRPALDFYQQPLRHREWVNAARPLPAGVGDLFESVAADSVSLERRAASLGVNPEELRAAGRFFYPPGVAGRRGQTPIVRWAWRPGRASIRSATTTVS